MTAKIARYFADRRPATPCLVVDLDVVEENFKNLRKALPDSAIYYAVKANPAPEILALLARLGSSFDTASVAEIDMVLAAGATADRISYGNTIKKEADIAAAFARGVRLYAFDSEAELEKISRAAPGVEVFCRILTSGNGADWPLSRKFGLRRRDGEIAAAEGARHERRADRRVVHVGSQQRDPKQWDEALAQTANLFRELEADGLTLRMVNLGGGFPTKYKKAVPTAKAYGIAITDALRRHFGNRIPETIIEPGSRHGRQCGRDPDRSGADQQEVGE